MKALCQIQVPSIQVRLRRWMRLMLAPCLLTCAMSGSLSAQTQVLTLACEDKTDFPNVLGEGQEIDWKKPGASIEFVKRLGDELGLKVVIKRMPWKRALELELKNGTVDGLFPISYRKDREPFGVLPQRDGKTDDSRSMFVSAYCFYKLKTSPLEWDGKVLKNLKGPIGASRGYSVVGDLQQMGYEVQESDDARKDLKRLGSGWLGAIAGLESAEDFLLESSSEFSGMIVKVKPPISTKQYFLMLSHQFVDRNPELAQRIWNKSHDLRDKEFPAILRKYMGK
jgi:polar amino acid transport system substrate-binding protein